MGFTWKRPGRGSTSSSLLNGARTGSHALQAPQLHSAGSQAGTGARTPAGIGARQANETIHALPRPITVHILPELTEFTLFRNRNPDRT